MCLQADDDTTTLPAVTERRIYRSPWRIDVMARDGVPRLLAAMELARLAAAALDTATALSAPTDAATARAAERPFPAASLGLILSDDRELAELNLLHMGKTGPTDVLSFPLLPAGAFPPHADRAVPDPAHVGTDFALPPGARIHLGDIVVSVERAVEQAETGRGGWTGDIRWSPADELRLLVVHGTLHVCGWDHADPAERTAMRALEARLLGRDAPR